jgi:FkbM family methyltransferase
MTLETFHDLITFWIIFFRKEYVVDEKTHTIVDAGANIGTFSLFAARTAPDARIVALEPFPTTRARLESHVKRNGLANRVECRPWALAGSEGRRFMLGADEPSQFRGLSEAGQGEEGVVVEAVTLERLLDRTGLECVDLLKMDIEGSEHEVLLSTSDKVLHRFKSIALEYHPNRRKQVLFARMLAAGFHVVRDIETRRGSDGGVAHFRRA